MKKRVFLLLLLLLIGCPLWYSITNARTVLPSQKRLSDCQVFLQYGENRGDIEDDEVRQITDVAITQQIAGYCAQTEMFREVVKEIDQLATGTDPLEPTILFKAKNAWYAFAFFDVEEQTWIDFVHRETPLLRVSVWEQNLEGTYTQTGDWLCSLPEWIFSQLYVTAASYTDGKILNQEEVGLYEIGMQ